MRASSLFAASASLLSIAHARIFGVGIPSTIKPGDSFDLIIKTQGYIQSITDVSIAVGYSLGGNPPADSLGTFITAFDLVEKSNDAIDFNETVSLPETFQPGGATFTASLSSLLGALYLPALTPFNVSFTIGDETSTTYVYGYLH